MFVKQKEYSNGDITIIWKPSLCIHSGNCVRGLPGVFNPNERPWIKVDNADSPHLIETVENCPSGALSWKRVQSGKFDDQVDAAVARQTKINVMKNGPILIEGEFTMTDSAGNKLDNKKQIALCRCGASANKPFCDGSHKKIEFEG